jgi:transcriptional regulator with XRE-family HTH domain
MNTVIEKSINVFGTQALLSEASGISQSAINKLLHSQTGDMRVSTMLRLSVASGIPVIEFIEKVKEGMSENKSTASSCSG